MSDVKTHFPALALMVAISCASSAAEPLVRRASLKQADGLISAADYPPSAIALKQEGVVVAAFRIAPDGKVTACNVAQSSGSDALDQRTCEIILQRFDFNPALTPQGTPTEEWRTQKFSWKLPVLTGEGKEPSKHAELVVNIGKDGSVESCEVIKSSGDAAWDLKMCTAVGVKQKFEPARDRQGRRQISRKVIPVWE